MNLSRPHLQRAIALLEILLAVAVFGIAAVALVRVVHQIGLTSVESALETRVIGTLETLLEEHGKAPNLRTGTIDFPSDADGVVYQVDVRSLPLNSSQGLALENLYRVRAVARWNEGPSPRTLEAETFRYAPMYQ